jgi:regulator of PEP synthase PpsR (kinase-PPPase family)
MTTRQIADRKVRDRTIFIVSDGTGITAENFAHAVLTQFEGVRLVQERLPFIDDIQKAREAVVKINDAFRRDGHRPVVFSTMVDVQINAILHEASAMHLDLFQQFVAPLEIEFGVKSTHTVGRTHTGAGSQAYKDRIEAINYSLAHDDGQTNKDLETADVILVGVSRSGKTPTSLYLAMQYGIKSANYPLIPEDFERGILPGTLKQFRDKLFGLSIAPERLAEIRNERRPNSTYASLENCRYEVAEAERLMRKEGIQSCNSTAKSIEEIATTIITDFGLNTRAY